ncbi:hypothetical protein NPIL_454431 [Nephila pilipes]|uniref:Uncharacterized protein n=1 Tax=Nephila pilipes TaxID=299642 RepID=A0A8X6MMM3_NEPPI|nr:hypothetical protein NPIL_454431 [Nephila pilipes]
MALQRGKDTVKSIQSDILETPVKEQKEIKGGYTIHQSKNLQLKPASEKYHCKRKSSDTSLVCKDQKIHLDSDAESSIFQTVCSGDLSSDVAECKTLVYEKKYPHCQVRNELKGPSCSLVGFSGEENNSMALGHRAEQISMHYSSEGSPPYMNVPIGDFVQESVTDKPLIYKSETPKLKVRSERVKPNCSASLSCEENYSTSLKNRAQRKEEYYSVKESTIFRNVNIADLSSETAEHKTLLYDTKYPKFQERKELDEPSCSMSFQNDMSDSMSILRVNLTPTYCNLGDERELLSHLCIVDNETTHLNVTTQTANTSRWRLRLGRIFRVIRGKMTKLLKGSPLNKKVTIGDIAGERVTDKTLIYKTETPKLKVKIQRGKPNCSASRDCEENYSTFLRNRALRKEAIIRTRSAIF